MPVTPRHLQQAAPLAQEQSLKVTSVNLQQLRQGQVGRAHQPITGSEGSQGFRGTPAELATFQSHVEAGIPEMSNADWVPGLRNSG